jgi:hypothetical protein
MDTSTYIPEQFTAIDVRGIYFSPPSKDVAVTLYSESASVEYNVIVDISTMLDTISAPNKVVIKTFFKKIGALALDVPDASVNGDIW